MYIMAPLDACVYGGLVDGILAEEQAAVLAQLVS